MVAASVLRIKRNKPDLTPGRRRVIPIVFMRPEARRGGAVKLIAHRGGRGFGTDNTIEAMRAAVRAGVRAIETDVRETVDGRLALCHDAIVRGRAVGRLTYEELISHEPARPLLEDLLEELAGWCAFNLEVKGAREESVSEMFDIYRLEADTLVTSFDRDFLERFKRLRPGAMTGYLYRMPYGKERKLSSASEIGADVILPHFHGVDEELVERARGLGLKVYTWTVNDLDDLDRLASLKVDGVITDRYLAFKAHVEETMAGQEE